MTKKTYKSEAFQSIHESATALHKVGAIDAAAMRKFDLQCTAPEPKSPDSASR